MQQIPVDGIVSVSTPQDLVGMIVGKAVNLASKMNIATISAVENMSYFECDECGKKHEIFGKSQVEEISKKYNIATYDKIPINSEIAKLCDNGNIEDSDVNGILNNTIEKII